MRVIADDGSEREVVAVYRHDFAGDIVRVTPRYLPPIDATPEHRFLVTEDPGRAEPYLAPAAHLAPGHFLVLPRRHHFSQNVDLDVESVLRPRLGMRRTNLRRPLERTREIIRMTADGRSSAHIARRLRMSASHVRHIRTRVRRRGGDIDALASRAETLEIEDGRIRFGSERRPGLPTLIPLTIELAELLGYYCAEGCVVTQRDRPNSKDISFSFDLHEDALAERTASLLRAIFGVRPAIRRNDATIVVSLGKSSLGVLLEALCGAHAPQKRVPEVMHVAERACVEAFLAAYFAGDGHRYENGKHSATTVSADLAWDVAWLLLRLGHLPSVYINDRPERGTILGRTVALEPQQFVLVYRENPPERRKYLCDENSYYIPIKAATRVPYSGPVYDLQVEGRHTFLANLVAVSNCQNWLTSQALRDERAQVPPEEITATQLADLAVRYDAAMIASSYNEPLITSEWGAAVMDEGRQRGLVRAFVSNGNATPEVLDFLRPHLDCYKVDLKAMRDAGYRQLGAKLENVLETIRGLKRGGFWVEIVTLLVPGLNDSGEEIRDAARFLASVDPLMPWHVTAFHPDYKMTDRAGTAARALVRAAEIGLEEGLRYVYCGNVPGRVGPYEDTRCHGCGATLVRRLGYTILEDRLTPTRGSCPECATRIPGIWERPAAIGVTATPGVARQA